MRRLIPWSRDRLNARAVIGWCAVVVLLGALATADGLVAVMIGALMAAIYGAIRWRGPRGVNS